MNAAGVQWPVHLRQGRTEPTGLMCLIGAGILAWTFAGFGVFWLRTGSGTIGIGGTFTSAGGIVWLAPIFTWWVAYVVGPRGRLRHLWTSPIRFAVDRGGLRWRLSDGATGSCRWEEFGGVSSGVDHRARWRAVFRRDGTELLSFAVPLVDEVTGRRASLPLLITAARPDLFEPLDPAHPQRAAVRGRGDVDGRLPFFVAGDG